MKKIRILRYYILVSTILLCSVAGCGGGGGSSDITVTNSGPPIFIESPTNGFSTTATSVTVTGFVNRRDGSFPNGSVSWSNGGSSGTTPVYCGVFCCFIVCTGSWQTTVPLNVGTNTITAAFEGASASVSVTRIPVFVVSGRASMQGIGLGLTSPDVLVARTDAAGSFSIFTILDQSGNYAFTGLLAGSYTIRPQLAYSVSSSCLTFTPASRTVDVITADVLGQDFTAAGASPCYSIRGQVTASNNPGFGVEGVDVFIKDSSGSSFRKVTDAQGLYEFLFLVPGTYTITPESCIWGTCNTFIPATQSVTIVSSDVTGQNFVEQF